MSKWEMCINLFLDNAFDKDKYNLSLGVSYSNRNMAIAYLEHTSKF